MSRPLVCYEKKLLENVTSKYLLSSKRFKIQSGNLLFEDKSVFPSIFQQTAYCASYTSWMPDYMCQDESYKFSLPLHHITVVNCCSTNNVVAATLYIRNHWTTQGNYYASLLSKRRFTIFIAGICNMCSDTSTANTNAFISAKIKLI